MVDHGSGAAVTISLLGDDEVRGEVVGVRYRDATSGFGVVEVAPTEGAADDQDGLSASGPLADLVEGQHVRLVGRWHDHPKYGRTFNALFYEQVAPDTLAGLKSFLSSERFEDVPDRAVQRVLTVFGRRAGEVIDREPSRLVDEAGIAADVADDLHQAWVQGRSLARLVTLLEPARVPMAVVRAAHAAFGSDADAVLRDDPWSLLEVDRARFAHADALARQLGGDPTDPARLAAGARATVTSARRRDGHQLVARDVAINLTSGLLGVDAIAAADGIDRAVAAGTLDTDLVAISARLRVGDDKPVAVVSTPAALRAEQMLAARLRTLSNTPGRLVDGAPGDGGPGGAAPGDVGPGDAGPGDAGPGDAGPGDAGHGESESGGVAAADSSLTTGQRAAVAAAFSTAVSVITGGPGTGKTTTVAAIVSAARDLGATIALCAPTGRAAKRLEELVGTQATTIHRLLAARPMSDGGFVFGHDGDDPLPADLVVVDEVSMCDTALLRSLVVAITDGTHLVLVGDPDQLPSVGSGDVLADIVDSGTVVVTQLDEIHRQAAASRIVALAREVNAGEVGPILGVDGDVFMAEESRRDVITGRVVEAVAERAPDYFDVDVGDIQVVAPMYRGPCGVDALNAAIKGRLNPDVGQASWHRFMVGDRVMVTRNDPELDVSNGDIGMVVDVATASLQVDICGRAVTFDGESVGELTLAWAITVHKSQGGQWPVVVLVADRSHHVMLRRNLVYTAISRASRALIIVGQAAAVATAATRMGDRQRMTALATRLRGSKS